MVEQLKTALLQPILQTVRGLTFNAPGQNFSIGI